MAEQAINTIYLLSEQPDIICDGVIKRLASRVFDTPSLVPSVANTQSMEEYESAQESELEGSMDIEISDSATVTGAIPRPKERRNDSTNEENRDPGDAFLLAQLVFVVGHVAIKHIVYLELIERELKRRKELVAKGESLFPTGQRLSGHVEKGIHASVPTPSKDGGEELDQVAGNIEDEIGDLIASVREEEMMYSPNSLLATFGPMIAHICLNPAMFKVSILSLTHVLLVMPVLYCSIKYYGPVLPFLLANLCALAPSSAKSTFSCSSACLRPLGTQTYDLTLSLLSEILLSVLALSSTRTATASIRVSQIST